MTNDIFGKDKTHSETVADLASLSNISNLHYLYDLDRRLKADKEFAENVRRTVEIHEDWPNIKPPALRFDADCAVTIFPPAYGAIVRFWVQKNDWTVSVYYDAFDRLGHMSGPYWEVYLFDANDQPERFMRGEERKMMDYIKGLFLFRGTK